MVLDRIRERSSITMRETWCASINCRERWRSSASLQFFLVWKDTEMPDDPTRERGFKAMKDELLDVLEWERAEYHTGEALLYT